MDLKAYLDGQPRGAASALAADLRISTVYLFQLAARQNGREPSPELCVRIEQETGEQVTRRDLRSDWQSIWPELAAPPRTPTNHPGERSTDCKPKARG